MTIDVYCAPGAAPSRAVLLTAAALDLEVNQINTNLMAADHLKPEFLKLNPQHTVPTIVDDGFALWESRAIIRYLVNKYGKETSLYPEDPKIRAVVDQRLDFDIGTLNTRFSNYLYPQIREGASPDEALLKKLEEALGFLDTFLEGQKYAAGPDFTLADLSLAPMIASIEVLGVNIQAYPNISKWYDLVKSTAPKYEEVSREGLDLMKMYMQKLRKE